MKIQLKRSNVLDGGSAKKPTAGQMEYGELAVNYNTSDTAIFLKDSANQIVRVGGFKAGDNINIDGDGNISADASYWEQTSNNLYPKTTTDNVLIGGTLPASPNINLKADGGATFAGIVSSPSGLTNAGGWRITPTNAIDIWTNNTYALSVADTTSGTANTGFELSPSGTVKIGGTLPASPNISLNADGSASFAGGDAVITPTNASFRAISSAIGVTSVCGSVSPEDSGGAIYALAVVSNDYKETKFRVLSDGSAEFAGTVTANIFDLDSLPALP